MTEYVAVVHCPGCETCEVYFNDLDTLEEYCSVTNESYGFIIEAYALNPDGTYNHRLFTFD